MILSFPELQARALAWRTRELPHKTELGAAMVAAEEAGEAASAICRYLAKTQHGIRQDEPLEQDIKEEFADCLIAFADYCSFRGWNLGKIISERAEDVFQRTYGFADPKCTTCGRPLNGYKHNAFEFTLCGYCAGTDESSI